MYMLMLAPQCQVTHVVVCSSPSCTHVVLASWTHWLRDYSNYQWTMLSLRWVMVFEACLYSVSTHPLTWLVCAIQYCLLQTKQAHKMYGTSSYHKIRVLHFWNHFFSLWISHFFLSHFFFIFSLFSLFLLFTGVVWFYPVPPLSSSSCCLLWVTVHWALQTKARKLPCLGTAVTCIHVHI